MVDTADRIVGSPKTPSNPYTYPLDPANSEDLTGLMSADPGIVFDCGAAGSWGKQARCVALSARVYFYSEGAGRTDNDVEAMRHVMWSMLLSRSIGYHSARRVRPRHEERATDRADSKRDRRNNAIGLRFANRFRGFAAQHPGYWNPNRVGQAKAIYDDERWHKRVWCAFGKGSVKQCNADRWRHQR